MILAVDNGSRYTKTLTETLRTIDRVYAVSYDMVSPGDIPRYSHYVLSGRRRNDETMNAVNASIIKSAIIRKRPLLGVCYGAQMLALVAGGTIRRMPTHEGGWRTVRTTANPLCSGIIDVFESHSYEVARLPSPLYPVGSSAACQNEIIRYGDGPIYGTQFHPEMSADGIEILRRFAAQA